MAGWALVAIKLGLPVVVLCAAGLMVSGVKYPHVVNQLARGKRSPWFLVKLLFGAVAVLALREYAVPLIAFWFAFSHPGPVGVGEGDAGVRTGPRPLSSPVPAGSDLSAVTASRGNPRGAVPAARSALPPGDARGRGPTLPAWSAVRPRSFPSARPARGDPARSPSRRGSG